MRCPPLRHDLPQRHIVENAESEPPFGLKVFGDVGHAQLGARIAGLEVMREAEAELAVFLDGSIDVAVPILTLEADIEDRQLRLAQHADR